MDTGRAGDAVPQLEVLRGGQSNIWDYQIRVGASLGVPESPPSSGETAWPTTPFYPNPLVSLSQSRQVGIHEVPSPCSGRLVLLGLALRALVGLLLMEHLCWDLSLDPTSQRVLGTGQRKDSRGREDPASSQQGCGASRSDPRRLQ